MLKFTKMNGAGNDFVMIDNRAGELRLSREEIARICDRHRGVGADGLIAVEASQNGADFRMRYYNGDGGEAEMCGNGARCFAKFAGRLAHSAEPVRFETMAGVVTAQLLGENVQLQMSAPRDLTLRTTLTAAARELVVHFANTGVPHAIVICDDVENVDVATLGAALRNHARFEPQGTNANFIQVLAPQRLAIRTYERGVEGETLACGTGACAAALVHHALTGAPAPISVQVRGGDTLEVNFERVDDGFTNVTLTGPADFVFEGQVSL